MDLPVIRPMANPRPVFHPKSMALMTLACAAVGSGQAKPVANSNKRQRTAKIFVHPLGTCLDVCNGHTRSLSVCHLRWWTNANELRSICKTLYKSDAAPRLEQHIDVTRRIVG